MSQNVPRFLDEPSAREPRFPQIEAPALLQPESGAAAAIGADWNPPRAVGTPRGMGSLALMAAGAGVILAAWLLFSIIAGLIGFFQVSPELGAVASAVVGCGLALLLAGVGREWRSLRRLHQVEKLRAALLTGSDVMEARGLCLAWLAGLRAQLPEIEALIDAARNASDVGELRGLLRSRLAPPLASATRAIGLRAATEVSALVAISPHASWDGPIVALRGLKVIRQVAQLHGLRPGPAVTTALLGRVARAAVETATVDLVSQAAADHFLNNLPLVRHLGAISGASTAAFRLYRLTHAASRACHPLGE